MHNEALSVLTNSLNNSQEIVAAIFRRNQLILSKSKQKYVSEENCSSMQLCIPEQKQVGPFHAHIYTWLWIHGWLWGTFSLITLLIVICFINDLDNLLFYSCLILSNIHLKRFVTVLLLFTTSVRIRSYISWNEKSVQQVSDSFSRMVDNEVHVIHISHVIITYTLDSLFFLI